MNEVTQLLNAIAGGDLQAANQLLPVVYDELRRLAAQKLACEKPGQTLQATALVHEAYLRLVERNEESRTFKDREHFFAAAAAAMRRILIDNARRKRAQKRGGGLHRQPLDRIAAPEVDADLLALDEALVKLAARDPVKATGRRHLARGRVLLTVSCAGKSRIAQILFTSGRRPACRWHAVGLSRSKR